MMISYPKPRDRRLWRLLPAPPLVAALVLTSGPALAQGSCRDGYETKACPLSREVATAPIRPVFAPTGWRTVALDHITIATPDYRRETAFYAALMGWTVRSDDGAQAVMDIGTWGTVIIRSAPERKRAVVEGFGFVIAPWSAVAVEAELRKRGLTPIQDNDGKGLESFHIRDPDGWDLQISNGHGLAAGRAGKQAVVLAAPAPAPFAPTGWKTVWLDHLSFSVTNYKETASFYTNLLGWAGTYDEGSQQELKIGDIGDIIVRGGNPSAPDFGKDGRPRRAVLDHISFGIAPWDTNGVRAALESRGLQAVVDTSTKDPIDVARYKSYHTRTPGGFNLQISFVHPRNRLALSDAVRPDTLANPPSSAAAH